MTERLPEIAARHVGAGSVPGMVALVAQGEDVQVEALGDRTIGGSPVARDSLFRIASITKPITAAATLAPIEEGLIGLDEPVDRLIPELADRRVLLRPDGPLDKTVPAVRPITTRDLLTFTFGFGMAVEMFMSPTSWPVVQADAELGLATRRLATRYRPTPDGLIAWDEPGGRWSRPPAFEDGAAKLVSTVDDLHAFARMFLGRRPAVLSPESLGAMTSDQLTAAQKARGGLGPDFFEDSSWAFCQAVYAAAPSGGTAATAARGWSTRPAT
jgi:CubicO group peptidase (beta-lactamase class C family)